MYRPYPNADRARAQLDRHHDEQHGNVPAVPLTPFTAALVQSVRNAQAAQTQAARTLAAAVIHAAGNRQPHAWDLRA